jgi:hypothetical protein
MPFSPKSQIHAKAASSQSSPQSILDVISSGSFTSSTFENKKEQLPLIVTLLASTEPFSNDQELKKFLGKFMEFAFDNKVSPPSIVVEFRMDADLTECISNLAKYFAALQSRTEIMPFPKDTKEFDEENIGANNDLLLIAAIDKFNQPLQQKINDLQLQYPRFRKIRGDGNCYYRAVMVGYLEQAIASPHRQDYFNHFAALIEKQALNYEGNNFPELVKIKYRGYKTQLQRLIDCLRLGEDHEGSISSIVKLQKYLNATAFDEDIVLAAKCLTAALVFENQELDCNGLSLNDALLLVYSDVTSISEFCMKYVMPRDVCAEGAHVNAGLLPSALGCDSNLVIVPREKDSKVSCVQTTVRSVQMKCEMSPLSHSQKGISVPVITLLLRPGHYDLLYTEQLASNLDEDIKAKHAITEQALPEPTPAIKKSNVEVLKDAIIRANQDMAKESYTADSVNFACQIILLCGIDFSQIAQWPESERREISGLFLAFISDIQIRSDAHAKEARGLFSEYYQEPVKKSVQPSLISRVPEGLLEQIATQISIYEQQPKGSLENRKAVFLTAVIKKINGSSSSRRNIQSCIESVKASGKHLPDTYAKGFLKVAKTHSLLQELKECDPAATEGLASTAGMYAGAKGREMKPASRNKPK